MKKFIFSFVLLALFSVSFLPQTSKKRTAGKTGAVRVKAAPTPPEPPKAVKEAPKTLGITVEKYIVDHEINADGTAVQTIETLQRFESDLVIERFKKFEREFNSDLTKAEVLEAYILKADGQKAALPPENIQIKPTAQAEAAPAFSSLKQVSVNFSELKTGDAMYLKVRLTTVKPNFDKKVSFIDVFPMIYDWKAIEVNLTAPADFPLNIQAVKLGGGRLADENGKARWQWRNENLKAYEIEPGMYDFFSESPLLAVTNFKNFEELGAAYWSETKKKAVITPEVQALADEITKGITAPEQQAYAIYEWVNKNIRYLSIVLDKGGWIPHSTTEILANRYGDCKDYSTIIYALLKAKGIESHPVLIRAEMGNWSPEVAVPDYFNHAILYIPSLNLFADATAPNTRLGLITQYVVGKKAVLSGEKTGVIETPKDNPDANQLLSDVEVNFAADGTVKAFSKNIYNGRSEIIFRPIFADSAIQRSSGNFVRLLLAYFGVDGTGKLVKIGNPFKVGEPFTVEFETELPNFTTFMPKGSLALPVAVNMMNTLELEQFVKTDKRQTNLIMGAMRFRESFKLTLPESVRVEALPPSVNFANAVGSYRNEFVIEGAGVRIVRELVIKKDVIPPQDYALARELIAKSIEAHNAEIKYSADPNLARQKSRELRSKRTPVRTAEGLADLMFSEMLGEKPLSRAEVAAFEAKLVKNPNDLEARKKLIRYYNNDEIPETPARRRLRLKHRLWLLQNHPEIEEFEIYGINTPYYTADQPEYQTIKKEWLIQLEADRTNARVRLNAVDFVDVEEPEIAEKLLAEGRKLDPGNFEFPLRLSKLFYEKADTPLYEKPEEKAERLKNQKPNFERAFEAGEAALELLKKERSEERDEKRGELLQLLAKTAFELEKFDRAARLATELILDFGQNASDGNYAEASHTGNIILGRVALRQNDLEKAGDYLLIAARAPLRNEKLYYFDIDLMLAAKLFEKGEKQKVAEYLKLCEQIFSTSKLQEEKIKILKAWQEQITRGVTPSFDFDKP